MSFAKGVSSRYSIIACPLCDLLQRARHIPTGYFARCCRCGAVLYRRKTNSVNRTLALVIAGIILYIPANIYPIMTFIYLGQSQTTTIWSGVKQLYVSGMWPIATLVLCASIVIPLLKLIGLAYLCLSLKWGWRKKDRTQLYQIIDVVGRWAMLDVFLLSILVATVKLGQIATIIPGPGSLSFAAVVVLTMLATIFFDPRLIWEPAEERK